MRVWISSVRDNPHSGYSWRSGVGRCRFCSRVADSNLRGICLRKSISARTKRGTKDQLSSLVPLYHIALPWSCIIETIFRHLVHHTVRTQMHHLHTCEMPNYKQLFRLFSAYETLVHHIVFVPFIIVIITLHNSFHEYAPI